MLWRRQEGLASAGYLNLASRTSGEDVRVTKHMNRQSMGRGKPHIASFWKTILTDPAVFCDLKFEIRSTHLLDPIVFVQTEKQFDWLPSVDNREMVAGGGEGEVKGQNAAQWWRNVQLSTVLCKSVNHLITSLLIKSIKHLSELVFFIFGVLMCRLLTGPGCFVIRLSEVCSADTAVSRHSALWSCVCLQRHLETTSTDYRHKRKVTSSYRILIHVKLNDTFSTIYFIILSSENYHAECR
jgi:hypothetical protein